MSVLHSIDASPPTRGAFVAFNIETSLCESAISALTANIRDTTMIQQIKMEVPMLLLILYSIYCDNITINRV